MHSELTSQWYIVTRYSIKKNANDASKGVLVAHTKYDVTEQVEEIIADAIADYQHDEASTLTNDENARRRHNEIFHGGEGNE